MSTHAGKIVINGATSQYDRWLPALRDGYANVDDRSLAELLEFSVSFGRLINFYDLANEVDGDWVDFFAIDPTIALASIETIGLANAETVFFDLEHRTLEARHFAHKFDLFQQMFATIVRLARQVNGWLIGLGPRPQSKAAGQLRRQIAAAVENSLGPQLRLLTSYAQGAGLPDALGQSIPLDLHDFLPIWQLQRIGSDGSIYRGPSRQRKIDHACPAVNEIFTQSLDTLSYLQASARASFAASLEDADHTPQTALYVAFAKLFETAQATANTISSRYIHFYYHGILREDLRPAVPDSVHLTFTLAADQGVTSTSVPRNTLFVAGRDPNGLDILFAADKSLLVTGASIAKLRTLRVTRGPLLPPAPPPAAPPRAVIQRVLGTDIATGNASGAAAGTGTSAWSTFGETQPGATDITVTTPATMGFAIASPYLLLTGGDRVVTLRLSYSQSSAARMAPLLEQLAEATKLTPAEVFRDVLLQAFTLYLSTATGWQRIEGRYDILLSDKTAGDPGFALTITLPASVPPIVAYDPAASADGGAAPSATAPTESANPDPTLPTLKAYLNQELIPIGSDPNQVRIYPLSLLSELDLIGWELRTDVKSLSALQVSNTDGPVDVSKPFLLLGSPVVLGSFLEIRHLELFAKTLDTLQVTIKWFGLPQNDDGFKGWYRDYVLGLNGTPQPDLFNNQVFRVGICVVNPGSWQLSDGTSGSATPSPCDSGLLYLFRSKSQVSTTPDCADTFPAQPLCPSTRFDSLTVTAKTPPAYYNAADSAVRVQLTAPPYAFGDDLYAQNVLKAVIDDLPDPTPPPTTPPPPAKCQQWKELWDASQLILQCLEACAKTPVDGFQACITQGLVTCLKTLLEMAVACILECLTKAETIPGAQRIDQLQQTFAALSDPSKSDAAAGIRHWIETTQATLDPALAPVLGECLKKCAMLIEAVLSIEACELDAQNEPPPAYRRMMTSCLESCAAKLAEPYVDCCETFKYPNQPWIPQADSVSVDYSAACTGTPGSDSKSTGRFFYLMPFDGYGEPPPEPVPPALLPHFSYEGNLYIGFSGLDPPQPLTLLFQMTAAGAVGWLEKAPSVVWQYLRGSQWASFEPAQILTDGTNGLQNSGVLALNLPTYQASHNTLLGADCQWLSAAVAADASLFPETSHIYPNALLATWRDNGSFEHLNQPLPPHTIKASVEELPYVATIDQPMQSFGGRPPETGRSFQTWMGERLRHKDRAILGWDYERLVLEAFPTIWKVQTLAARNMRRGAAPGDVLVVVVPGADSIEVIDPTAPLASADMLAQIGASLAAATSPFVQLSVSNPIYVRITVTAKVQFSEDEDPGACIRRLDTELVQYLSPWFYDAARATKGGNYASEDEIIEFVQTRAYVDAVVSIAFDYHPQPQNLEWYFLTSAKQHAIEAVNTEPAAM
ncbi:hypothetical protein [Bradyrhizobium prioriisuperbiae]|uniref:hypothetical protein n=1 Tax=Bradyrhizobium prioriisuperbiae TaxID=2854389 RepID=UPI0028EB897D|nr:hypothetical protein [Bradyrhizobium prioritasuperba]